MLELDWQTAVFPEMLLGCAGKAPTEMANGCAGEAPQVLLAVTVIVPPVAPGVAEMVLEVLLPDHPPGKVHV